MQNKKYTHAEECITVVARASLSGDGCVLSITAEATTSRQQRQLVCDNEFTLLPVTVTVIAVIVAVTAASVTVTASTIGVTATTAAMAAATVAATTALTVAKMGFLELNRSYKRSI